MDISEDDYGSWGTTEKVWGSGARKGTTPKNMGSNSFSITLENRLRTVVMHGHCISYSERPSPHLCGKANSGKNIFRPIIKVTSLSPSLMVHLKSTTDAIPVQTVHDTWGKHSQISSSLKTSFKKYKSLWVILHNSYEN